MSQKNKETQLCLAKQNIKRELGKMIAGSFYDHQEVRITEFNRIRDIIRRKLENIPLVGAVEKKKKDEEKFKEKFVDKEIPIYLKQLLDKGKITGEQKHYIERILEVQKNAEKFEKEYEKLMKEFVESEPIYIEFLSKIKGISGILSANLIKEFGYCENAPYISSLWKFTGMHVKDEKAPVRKRGEKLEFNARLRTMVWKIGDSFVKQRTPFYRKIYDKEKKKQIKLMEGVLNKLTKEQEKELKKIKKREEKREFFNKFNPKAPVSLMNADLRARRKMVKIFLAHYWQAGKELSQLRKETHGRLASQESRETHANLASQKSEETQHILASQKSEETQHILASQILKETHSKLAKPYVADKLGHKHISNWREAVREQVKKKVDNKIAKIRKKPIKT